MALVKCKECTAEISDKTDKCPQCGAPAKKRTSAFTWIITIVVLLWVIGYISGGSGGDTGSSVSAASAPSAKDTAMGNVHLEYTWHKEGFDNVMEATFVIKNGSQREIKDVEIECTHYAKSGTRIDSNKRTIFDVIPANGKKRFEDFNMGLIHTQVHRTSCDIIDLEIT
jgi:hypothetical protein